MRHFFLRFSKETSSSFMPSSLRSSRWDDANLLFNSQLFLTCVRAAEIHHPSNRLKRARPSPLLPRWLISWNSFPPKTRHITLSHWRELLTSSPNMATIWKWPTVKSRSSLVFTPLMSSESGPVSTNVLKVMWILKVLHLYYFKL